MRSITLAPKAFFQITLLHRRERAIHHDEADLFFGDKLREFLDLAAAKICRRADFAQKHQFGGLNIKIDGERKPRRLFEQACLGRAQGYRLFIGGPVRALFSKYGPTTSVWV